MISRFSGFSPEIVSATVIEFFSESDRKKVSGKIALLQSEQKLS